MADNIVTEIQKLDAEFKSAIDRADGAAKERLANAISDLEKKMRDIEIAANRPQAGDVSAKEAEHKSAFVGYLRTGDKAPLAEFKSMSAGSLPDGGYTVPKVIDDTITKTLVDISPLRSACRVISVSTPDFHIPFSLGGTQSAWVGETDPRSNPTNTSQLIEIIPAFGELMATPMVTQTLLEDSQFDIAGFVAGEVATEFARAEGAAFVSGTGVKMPKGFLSYSTAATADASRAYGTLQFVPSAATVTADALIALVFSLKAGFRAGSKWLMNKATLGVVRSLKDAYGQYLLQTGLVAGMAPMLLGYEVIEAEDMPGIATNAFPIAFGNWQAGYTIADRVGTSMLYNPYINAPYIAYQSRKRVGGTMVDTQAIKLLKIVSGS